MRSAVDSFLVGPLEGAGDGDGDGEAETDARADEVAGVRAVVVAEAPGWCHWCMS